MVKKKMVIPGISEKVHDCKCGCGQKHRPLPFGTWMSHISGWHRVRIVGIDGPQHSSEEIGCGNDPDDAVKEAWCWFEERMKSALTGKCWFCDAYDKWWEEYSTPVTCPSCKKEYQPIEEE